MNFYVYTYTDADGVCRYVGKGKGGRSRTHYQEARRIVANGQPPETATSLIACAIAGDLYAGRDYTINIVADGLSEREAYGRETDLIGRHGIWYHDRDGTGTLFNVLAGGAGFITDNVTRREIAARAVATRAPYWSEVAQRAAATRKARRNGVKP
jgi:hypothetical protein